MTSSVLGLCDIIQNDSSNTMLEMPFKNSKVIFWMSSRKFEEIQVSWKYHIFFSFIISGKFVVEICMSFAQEAEMHVTKTVNPCPAE